jgi:hypothetical protein
MLRSPRRNNRHKPSCSCLVDAYLKFPAQADSVRRCASPNCPVKSLDGITLHQFLEAIREADGTGDSGITQTERGKEFFRAMARRRRRQKSRRPPE